MASGQSTVVVLVALGCNLAIAVAKFVAFAWTGSSAMLSEAIHSLVDTSNQGLLLHGIRRARRPADAKYPFGYGRELYFWSFIVAILLFSLGAGVALYEGFQKLHEPHPLQHAYINYIVLAVAIALESISTWKAVSEFNARRGTAPALVALRASKDPALFAIVLEDLAALAGLFVALAGVFAADRLGIPEADGVASIVIGLILGAVAAFMSVEIKGLIVGEAAVASVRAGLRRLLGAETGTGRPIRTVNEIRTMHMGPEDVLVAASADFHDGMTAQDVEAATARIERAIRGTYPEVTRVFLEVQSAEAHLRLARAAAGGHGDDQPAPEPARAAATARPSRSAAAVEPARAAATAAATPPPPSSSRGPGPAHESRKSRKRGKKKDGRR